MPRLITENANPEIQRRRRIREQLRGLAIECANGYHAYFHFQEYQDIKIPDGTDAKGNTKYRTVSVLVTFTHGSFAINVDAEKPVFNLPGGGEMLVVPGFAASMTFASGTYSDHGGGTTGARTLGHNELQIQLIDGNKGSVR